MAVREEELGSRTYATSARIVVDETTSKHLEVLNKICSSDAITNRVGNGAHQHTSTIIRSNLPVLFAIDSISTPSMDLATLQNEITSCATDSGINTANISATFARIQSASPPVDTESQVNVVEIISRTWSLACAVGNGYKTMIASCLSDNIGDGGGCLPGVTARLFGPYAGMLRELFDDAIRTHQIRAILSESRDESKDESKEEARAEPESEEDLREREVVGSSSPSPSPKKPKL